MRSVWVMSHATEPAIDTNQCRSYHVITTTYRHQTRCRFTKVDTNIDRPKPCTHTQCHAMFLRIQMHDVNAFISCYLNICNYISHNHFTDGYTSYTQFACYSISSNNTQIYSTQGSFQSAISLGLSKVGLKISSI